MSRKRTASAAFVPPPALSNRLQLLPVDVAKHLLGFCRYDGHSTALDFCRVMKDLNERAYASLEEDELLRAMPHYIKVRGDRLKQALRDELLEAGKDATKVRGRNLRQAERRDLLAALEPLRIDLCRFCMEPSPPHVPRVPHRFEPLSRGLRRDLGAYSLGKDVGGLIHLKCATERAMRLRQDPSGTLAWMLAPHDDHLFVEVALGESQRTKLQDGIMVQTQAYHRARDDLRNARQFYSDKLVPLVRSELWSLEKEVRKSEALASVPDSVLPPLIAAMAAYGVNVQQLGRLVPDMTLGVLNQLVGTCRTHALLSAALKTAESLSNRTREGYAVLIRFADPQKHTAESVCRLLVETARRRSRSWLERHAATNPHAGIRLIDSAYVAYQVSQDPNIPADLAMQLIDRDAY